MVLEADPPALSLRPAASPARSPTATGREIVPTQPHLRQISPWDRRKAEHLEVNLKTSAMLQTNTRATHLRPEPRIHTEGNREDGRKGTQTHKRKHEKKTDSLKQWLRINTHEKPRRYTSRRKGWSF